MIASIALSGAPAGAQVIQPLLDIETGPGPNISGFPGGLGGNDGARLGSSNLAVFPAADPEHGTELWLSTGASATLLKDINPGPNGGNPSQLVSFDGKAWFRANDGVFGEELWVTDGSPGGTHMVGDMVPGPGSAGLACLSAVPSLARLYFRGSDAQGIGLFYVAAGTSTIVRASGVFACPSTGGLLNQIVALGSEVVFAGRDLSTTTEIELYASDGTEAGARLIKDIDGTGNSSSPRLLTPVGSRVVFEAHSATQGRELFVTDGTSDGTVLVRDIRVPGDASINELASLGSTVLFSAVNGSLPQLWVSDGNTAEPVDIGGGERLASPSSLRRFGNEICMSGSTATTGAEIYCSNGQAGGTRLLRNIVSGTNGSLPSKLLAASTPAGARLYFSASLTSGGTPRLFVSDGTTVNTLDLGSAARSPTPLVALDNALLFAATDAASDTELWRTDGSVIGTQRLADIGSAPSSSLPGPFLVAGNKAYFPAFRSDTGVEMWVTDGTAIGTALTLDIRPGTATSLNTDFTTFDKGEAGVALGDKLIFSATDGVTGIEPWVSDGSAAGTMRLMDIQAGNNTSGPKRYAVLDDRAYFLVPVSSTLKRLFSTDGTPQGTVELSVPGELRFFSGFWSDGAGTLFIAVDGNTTGVELWRLNAARSGIEPVVELVPGTGSTGIGEGIDVNGTWLWNGSVSAFGAELMFSDGTAMGTGRVVDLVSGSDGSVGQFVIAPDSFQARSVTRLGSRIVYPCTISTPLDFEPCVSDGTAVGTGLLIEIAPGATSSRPTETLAAGDRVYFAANAPATGRSLYATDLTAAGTSLIASTSGIVPNNLVALPNGELVMAGALRIQGVEFGEELFAGKPNDIRGFNLAAGELSSGPRKLASFGQFVLFRASAGSQGNEPWIYKSRDILVDSFE